MTEFKRIYKCNICGNVVEVLNTGKGDLVCCGENMQLLSEEIKDEGKEKHIPVIEKKDNDVLVKVGEVEHPMTEDHYIQWIECMECGCRKFLKPGDKPEAIFKGMAENCSCENCSCDKIRIYCNIHGVWRK